MISLGKLRTVLYAVAKLLGDVQAVRNGPTAMVKRLARREAGRMTAEVLWKWFK